MRHLLSAFGIGLTLGILLFSLPMLAGAQALVDTTFTYQGRLVKGTSYVEGICNFLFDLYSKY